jgi:type 1 fimbria pilin
MSNMKRMIKFIGLIGVAVAALLNTRQALAACYFNEGKSEEQRTSPFPVQNVSAFAHHTDSLSFIAHSIYYAFSAVGYCDNPYYLTIKIENMLGINNNMTSVGGNQAVIYDTNYDGLSAEYLGGVTAGNFSGNMRVYYRFGSFPPGTIMGENLPKVVAYLTESETGIIDSTSLRIGTYSLSGSINVTKPTCKFENKVVNLGHHSPEFFSAIGTATEWVDSTVRYECGDQIYAGNVSINSSYLSGESYTVSNYRGVFINANTEFIDARKGIFKLDDSSDSATGIGIQISRARSEDSFASTAMGLVTSSTSSGDGQTYFDFPLFARYIQTDNTVTPGRANGKIVLTTNYE